MQILQSGKDYNLVEEKGENGLIKKNQFQKEYFVKKRNRMVEVSLTDVEIKILKKTPHLSGYDVWDFQIITEVFERIYLISFRKECLNYIEIPQNYEISTNTFDKDTFTLLRKIGQEQNKEFENALIEKNNELIKLEQNKEKEKYTQEYIKEQLGGEIPFAECYVYERYYKTFYAVMPGEIFLTKSDWEAIVETGVEILSWEYDDDISVNVKYKDETECFFIDEYKDLLLLIRRFVNFIDLGF